MYQNFTTPLQAGREALPIPPGKFPHSIVSDVLWRCGEQGVKNCAAAYAQVLPSEILAWSKIERPCEPLATAH
jgi:hypothetical protein